MSGCDIPALNSNALSCLMEFALIELFRVFFSSKNSFDLLWVVTGPGSYPGPTEPHDLSFNFI